MKNIFIIIFIAIGLAVSAQELKPNQEKVDFLSAKTVAKHYNSRSAEWVLDRTDTYTGANTEWLQDGAEFTVTRNGHGFPLTIQTQVMNGASLENEYFATLTYYQNDSVFEYNLQEWNGSAWSDVVFYEKFRSDGQKIESINGWYSTRSYNTFDAQGKKTENLEQDYINNAWVDFARTLYTYNANNLLEGEEYQQAAGGWTTKVNTTHTYTNLVLTETNINYVTEGGQSRTQYSYYPSGKIQQELVQNLETGNWVTKTRINYEYTAEGLLSVKSSVNLDDPSFGLRHEYTYNAYGNEDTYFVYDNSDNWTLFYKRFNTYDANQNITEFYTLAQATRTRAFVNMDRSVFTWSSFVGVEKQIKKNTIKIAPIPAENFIQIHGLENKSTLEIIDLTGKQIAQFEITKKQAIDISKLKAGVYFAKVITPNGTIIKKFIKR